jgi:hypothetical protein
VGRGATGAYAAGVPRVTGTLHPVVGVRIVFSSVFPSIQCPAAAWRWRTIGSCRSQRRDRLHGFSVPNAAVIVVDAELHVIHHDRRRSGVKAVSRWRVPSPYRVLVRSIQGSWRRPSSIDCPPRCSSSPTLRVCGQAARGAPGAYAAGVTRDACTHHPLVGARSLFSPTVFHLDDRSHGDLVRLLLRSISIGCNLHQIGPDCRRNEVKWPRKKFRAAEPLCSFGSRKALR